VTYSSSIEMQTTQFITKGHMMTYALHHAATCKPRPRTNVIARLFAIVAIARQRRQLRQLDDHQLCDIGITRAQALQEANKSSWDAPQNWINRSK
jgi:uncharacterized protein YjiS (DUF1127 family)